jgi:long-chain acyl-CoA synthetase
MQWCKQNDIDISSNKQLIENEQFIAQIRSEVNQYNQGFGNWEQVKKFELLPAEWSVETGELTPTLKLKRKIIMAECKSLVEKIYETS